MNGKFEPPRVGDRRAIMALLDMLGGRWTLRILWELREGALSSRALRSAAGDLSPTVLQARINELRDGQIVELRSDGYALTPLGNELLTAFWPLYTFAERWAQAVASRND
jgi:DNA-binding HxlR family transcriptional regulator